MKYLFLNWLAFIITVLSVSFTSINVLFLGGIIISGILFAKVGMIADSKKEIKK
jgi:hypothetical protein